MRERLSRTRCIAIRIDHFSRKVLSSSSSCPLYGAGNITEPKIVAAGKEAGESAFMAVPNTIAASQTRLGPKPREHTAASSGSSKPRAYTYIYREGEDTAVPDTAASYNRLNSPKKRLYSRVAQLEYAKRVNVNLKGVTGHSSIRHPGIMCSTQQSNVKEYSALSSYSQARIVAENELLSRTIHGSIIHSNQWPNKSESERTRRHRTKQHNTLD